MTAAGVPITDPERAFLEHLPTIDKVIGIIAIKNALSPSDADEFGSWVRARIVDTDYGIFRKYAGRSSIATYLSVVLSNLFHDYRNSVWGRWRPSMAATRMGPVGMRLEELLHRDNYTLREAIEILRSAGFPESDVELGRMARSLPVRQPSSEVPLEALTGLPQEVDVSASNPDGHESDFAELLSAMTELPVEDQVILHMRYWDNISVADIARALNLEPKPLYRRIDSIEQELRRLLTSRGFDIERVRDLLSSGASW